MHLFHIMRAWIVLTWSSWWLSPTPAASGGAAAALHTAQPALSRRLARVERELGGRLFDRGRHGAVATPAGRVVVERARAALDAITAAERAGAAALSGRTGRLVVGAAPTLGAELLPEALARHRRDHPEVGFELVISGDNPGLRRRLLSTASSMSR